jgi:Chalcone isomerase-like
MSFSSPCASRRDWLRLALFASAGLAAKAGATPPQWPARGQGRMRFLGLSVYDIALSSPDPLQASWAAQPLMLTLSYARALKGGAIAERSLEEMRRQGPIAEADAQRWLAGMREAFPDVKEGDRLAGLHEPGEGARFWFNGTPRGPRFDADFSRRFFGIWLAPETSEPKLRAQLLGL